MTQESVWDKEYKKSQLLTKDNKPQMDVVRFVDFLKKKEKISLENVTVLDLGSGAGRNSFYFASLGNKVTGLEISRTAIDIARKYMNESGLTISYHKQSIGDTFPLPDNSCEIALDVTSSNSLSESEREVYLLETHRVLKSNGYFFLKGLCKEGDEHAKYLLKHFPAKEKDTYIMPDIGVVERVWSKDDLVSMYEKYFKIIHMEKKTNYSRMNNRSYKRNFWILYMKKI